MTDIIFESFLFFTRIYVLIPLVIIGYFSKKSAAFEKALYILLFTILLSPYLKSIWQVPLNPALNREGYAFPSGHMQMAVVFWGLLAYELRQKWLSTAIAFMLIGIGYALIYFGYHTLIDILGALFFSILTILLFVIVDKKYAKNKTWRMGLFCSVLGTILLFMIPNIGESPFLAIGALYGFTLGSYINPHKKYQSLIHCIAKCIMAFAGAALIYVLIPLLPNTLPYYLKLKMFIQYFSIGLWVAGVAPFIIYLFSLLFNV